MATFAFGFIASQYAFPSIAMVCNKIINGLSMSNSQVQSSILNPASVIYGILDSHIKRHHCINQNLKVGWSWLKFAAVVVVLFLPAKKMACRTFKLVIKGSNRSIK